ncbi:MAG: hypothetical protein LBT40_07885 [Deltaproteobacteria bacterium]|nr:hypothetical protein [Deltaproteobacteria bacterium]
MGLLARRGGGVPDLVEPDPAGGRGTCRRSMASARGLAEQAHLRMVPSRARPRHPCGRGRGPGRGRGEVLAMACRGEGRPMSGAGPAPKGEASPSREAWPMQSDEAGPLPGARRGLRNGDDAGTPPGARGAGSGGRGGNLARGPGEAPSGEWAEQKPLDEAAT